MPASIYKILYNDPDCTKLPPRKKNGINTYTKEKIPVIGFWELFVLHQDDKCFHEVKFQMVSVEGSIIISCATSINLNLIQIHDGLYTKIPDCTRLVYSCADAPYKYQYKEKMFKNKTVCHDKNCQATHMWPQKQAMKNMDMWTVTHSKKKQSEDKNCQSRYFKGMSPKGPANKEPKCQVKEKPVFSEKKHQATYMQPQKPIQKCYRRLCKGQTCQSTRCFKNNQYIWMLQLPPG